MSETSEALWTATGNMIPNMDGIQFGNVSIVIPTSWGAIADENITWQQCNKAEILISRDRSWKQNDSEPFTKQTGNCGQPGEFIRIPHSFLNSKDAMTMNLRGKEITFLI